MPPRCPAALINIITNKLKARITSVSRISLCWDMVGSLSLNWPPEAAQSVQWQVYQEISRRDGPGRVGHLSRIGPFPYDQATLPVCDPAEKRSNSPQRRQERKEKQDFFLCVLCEISVSSAVKWLFAAESFVNHSTNLNPQCGRACPDRPDQRGGPHPHLRAWHSQRWQAGRSDRTTVFRRYSK